MERRKLKVIIGVVLVVLSTLFIVLFQFLGLKYYLEALSLVNSLSKEDQKIAYQLLGSNPETTNAYSGTLAYLSTSNKVAKGIWIWGLNGLRYFSGDENTIYSDYNICDGKKWQTNTPVDKNYNIGFDKWIKNVKQGDYVGVFLNSTNDNRRGKVIELYSYDWWVFVSIQPNTDLERACAKR